MSRIGLVGGTFDPIHNGHILLGRRAAEEFSLDEVWYLPAGDPYFKAGQGVTGAEERLYMTELALLDEPNMRSCDIELKRTGETYTWETVALLNAAYPENEFFFILGADCLGELDRWRYPERILAGCAIIAATRGNVHDPEKLRTQASELTSRYGGSIYITESPVPEVSSTGIRRRAARGGDIRSLVPESVAEYIAARGLYRA